MSLDDLFADLSIANTHQPLYRNIVSLRESEDIFDDLSEDPRDWEAAIEAELQAKPAAYESSTPVIDRPFEEAEWFEAIGYPFQNWMKSRFSNGSFGVWYGASDLETTVHETVHHWTHGLLADAGFLHPGIIQERRIHLVQCDAALIDLRPKIARFPDLVSNVDYTLTQQVGARLHREGHPGLVTQSARCEGDAYAILNAQVLSAPRPYCYLTYATEKSTVTVDRAPGDHWLTIPYS